MSAGVKKKKQSTCYVEILMNKIHRLAEIGKPLPSKIFKIKKNGSVLQNEVKHTGKVLFLSKNNNEIIPNKSNMVY
jgi:hypothetical protein